MKILLVEDEQQIRELLLHLLKAEGHDVTTAENGQQGWERYEQAGGDFNVVIADMKMPVLDGLGLLQRVREQGRGTPCVLMTGHADLEDDTSDLLAGTEVLYKPFDIDEMLKTVLRVGGVV
jgi:CheY-like chemotaxis protein